MLNVFRNVIIAAVLVAGVAANSASAQTGNCSSSRINKLEKDINKYGNQVTRLQEQIAGYISARAEQIAGYESDINYVEDERVRYETDLNNISSAVQCIAQLPDLARVARCTLALGDKIRKRISALVIKERRLRDSRDNAARKADLRISRAESKLAQAQQRLAPAQAGLEECRSVFFNRPNNNANVASTFQVIMRAAAADVAARGVSVPNTGHFVIVIDGGPIALGTPVSATSTPTLLVFADGSSQAMVTLTPGSHTLTLQFVDGAGNSYGPSMSKTITVNVGN